MSQLFIITLIFYLFIAIIIVLTIKTLILLSPVFVIVATLYAIREYNFKKNKNRPHLILEPIFRNGLIDFSLINIGNEPAKNIEININPNIILHKEITINDVF